MRRVVLIIPHWLSEPGLGSVMRTSTPSLSHFAEAGRIEKCIPMPDDLRNEEAKGSRAVLTPEAAWLGMDPAKLALQDGPLTVSALGVDPPTGSVHFHLSLMSFVGGAARSVGFKIPPAQFEAICETSKKLNTKTLTFVKGEGYDHGLVWEDGSLELGTVSASAIDGKHVQPMLPEGDGEPMLRRYIDDSINLLSELPLNNERAEEGLPPLNLLWPWGQGFRVDVPNLAIRRGETCRVESASLRLQGLTRLSGYRHGDRSEFGVLANLKLDNLLGVFKNKDCTIALIESFGSFREAERWEQMEWLSKQLDTNLFSHLWEMSRTEPLSLKVVACGGYTGRKAPLSAAREGLVLSFTSGGVGSNSIPFDERALEEKSLQTTTPWKAVEAGLL